jgi:maltose O-acetyltransferase
MPSEREKMVAGELYSAADPELVEARRRARDLTRRFNDSPDAAVEERRAILGELFARSGEGLWIEPPFYCDYGTNTRLGDRVYFNFNCVLLDVAEVVVGDDVLFGPSVQIYTALHPLDYRERRTQLEMAKPIEIGSDVWVGGGVIVCPGVRIGSRSVVGAGSVVTRDVPESVFAAGNPCRVVRVLE